MKGIRCAPGQAGLERAEDQPAFLRHLIEGVRPASCRLKIACSISGSITNLVLGSLLESTAMTQQSLQCSVSYISQSLQSMIILSLLFFGFGWSLPELLSSRDRGP